MRVCDRCEGRPVAATYERSGVGFPKMKEVGKVLAGTNLVELCDSCDTALDLWLREGKPLRAPRETAQTTTEARSRAREG